MIPIKKLFRYKVMAMKKNSTMAVRHKPLLISVSAADRHLVRVPEPNFLNKIFKEFNFKVKRLSDIKKA